MGAARRKDLAPPGELLQRLRWTFLGISLLGLCAALMVVGLDTHAQQQERLAAAAGACWLGWAWVSMYRRGAARPEEDLLSLLALVAVVLGVRVPEYSLGLMGMGASLRALHTLPRVRGALLSFGIFAVPYLVAFSIEPGLAHAGTNLPGLFLGLSTIGLGVAVGHLLAVAAERHQRVLDRAQELRQAGERLAAAVNPGHIETELMRACQRVLAGLGPLQLAVARLTGTQVILSGPVSAGTDPGSWRRAPLPKLTDGSFRTLLGAGGTAVIEEEARQALDLDPRLFTAAAVPLGPSGESRGSLVVATRSPLPAELDDALRILAGQAGLAFSRAELSQAIRASEARFRGLVQASTDLVVAVDTRGEITYVSPSVEALLGRGLRSGRLETPSDSVHPQDMARLATALQEEAPAAGSRRLPELRVRDSTGNWRRLEVQATNLLNDPDVAAMVLTGRDVTERRALEDQLRHQALHDPLTGLANRVLLRDRIDHALHARRSRLPLGVLLVDLDDFKNINDSYGHAAGDAALLEVTRLIRLCLRPGDTFARLGGDEFAVLLEELQAAEMAETVAERISESLRQPVRLPNWEEVGVTASIGVVTCEAPMDPEVLLRNADIALYAAKAEGKGGHVVFRDFLHRRAVQRMHVENGLRRALERDELALHYQPIVLGSRRKVLGVEALLRWNDPEQGLMMPKEFVSVAEATGLIVPLGRWVLSEACLQVRSWQRTLPGMERLALAVNVSARQLHGEGIVAHVESALATSGLDPSLLTLEVTESVIASNSEEAIARLAEVRRLGIHVAIDDFGTGQSSLAQLQLLPVDCIKIDQSFVRRLRRESTAGAVIQSMVDLARALGLEVVVEGIESAGQARTLAELAPEAMLQGHHFAPALTPHDLETMITSGRRPRRRRTPDPVLSATQPA